MEKIARFLGTDLDKVGLALLVHLNILVYSLAYWCQQPSLSFMVKDLIGEKESDAVGAFFGFYQSLNSFFETLATVIFSTY